MRARPEKALEARRTKIDIDRLTKVFPGRKSQVVAVADFTFQVEEGQFIVIVGPSGCGKTTLLRILAGLETPTSGRFQILRESQERPLNAMVFQEASVLPWMTVQQNVEYGLRMRGVPQRQREEVALRFIELMGLADFRHAYPHQLSGGMKQRVSVARAFATDPEVLLMDEPFAALDEQTKVILQEELLRIWDESHKTVVFITHSIDEALVLADRVVVMSARPGRIKEVLPVEFQRPRQVIELKADPYFGEMSREIWYLLRDEVRRASEGARA